jgi:hypothetical protein
MPLHKQLPFSVEAAAKLLREPGTLGTPLLAIALAAYGPELFGDPEAGIPALDPIELWTRMEEDFRATLPDAIEARLQAIMLAVSTDAFYEDPLAFMSIGLALASGDLGTLPDGILEELTLPEAVWAAYEVALVRDDDVKFAPPILRLFDEIINAEADDAEAGLEEPSNETFMRDMKMDLASQMQQLGVQIPELRVSTLAQ